MQYIILMENTSSTYNKPDKSYIAFFDLDRTILNTNSGNILIKRAYRHKHLRLKDILKGLYFASLYRLNLRDPQKIIDSLAGWVKGVSVDAMYKLTREIFNDYLIYAIHSEVQSEIEFHKANGGKIVMLSSAIFPLASLFSEHLHMDDILCSRLESIDGIYTGRPEGKLCFREEKLNQLLEYCESHHVKPLDSWYYADSIADFPALKAVGFPVCINPDRKLRKSAEIRDWKILKWT
jgi:HAD superfamily hydrolase (TIGR01490 family)